MMVNSLLYNSSLGIISKRFIEYTKKSRDFHNGNFMRGPNDGRSMFGTIRRAAGGIKGPSFASLMLRALCDVCQTDIVKDRTFFVGGNWKMNGTEASIKEIVSNLKRAKLDSNVEVVICPPYPYLKYTKSLLPKNIEIGAQNCYKLPNGAFTGEVSSPMIKDVGATWVLLGHSERRSLFGETDAFIGEKLVHAQSEQLKIIACVGESLEERDKGKTSEVIIRQLNMIACQVLDWKKVIIAYEPIWAIGTGKVATPEQAQDVHSMIRCWLSNNVSNEAGETTRIIYGGSVSASNCKELAKMKDIDGFLVGGASLKEEFVDIINSLKPPSPKNSKKGWA